MKNIKKHSAIVLLSGGLDSAVATSIAKEELYDLYFLFFSYGQKTYVKEKSSLIELTSFFKPMSVKEIALPWLKRLGGSALFDKKTQLNENNFLLEYVPFRNSIFLSVATAYAEVLGADAIFLGSSGGDRICPDNSFEYLHAFQNVIAKGTLLKKDIRLVAPLIDTDKIGAVKLGNRLETPFHLTWSCHNNIDKACGVCSNCISRLNAFKANGASDPIPYV